MLIYSLIKNGPADESFRLDEVPDLKVGENRILIDVEGFGLNYADVLARKGLYPDCPPLPAVIGYEAVGRVRENNSERTDLQVGDRVLVFCRFGGYATQVETDPRAVVKIPEETGLAEGCALAVQYGTAYFSAHVASKLHPGDKVLVHAAAGGVGTALIQLAKHAGCYVIGTAGSDEKIQYLKDQGVDLAINYRRENFDERIRAEGHKRVDVVFDSVGGKTFKKSLKLLNFGGRIITFGAASRSSGGLLSVLKLVFGYGFYTPIKMLMKSQSIIGVNMLRIGDHKPEWIEQSFKNVVDLLEKGALKPQVEKVFDSDQLAEAHKLLESRKSKGKIAVRWKTG